LLPELSPAIPHTPIPHPGGDIGRSLQGMPHKIPLHRRPGRQQNQATPGRPANKIGRFRLDLMTRKSAGAVRLPNSPPSSVSKQHK
jgi:hypothetical protein